MVHVVGDFWTCHFSVAVIMHNCSKCPFFSVSDITSCTSASSCCWIYVQCSTAGHGRSFNSYLSFKTHVTLSHPAPDTETTNSDADETGTVVPDSVQLLQYITAGDLRVSLVMYWVVILHENYKLLYVKSRIEVKIKRQN